MLFAFIISHLKHNLKHGINCCRLSFSSFYDIVSCKVQNIEAPSSSLDTFHSNWSRTLILLMTSLWFHNVEILTSNEFTFTLLYEITYYSQPLNTTGLKKIVIFFQVYLFLLYKCIFSSFYLFFFIYFYLHLIHNALLGQLNGCTLFCTMFHHFKTNGFVVCCAFIFKRLS